MNFIDKLERKFGHLGIPNLMLYIIVVNVIGAALFRVSDGKFMQFLSLDVYQVLHGQIWRIFTFIIAVPIGDVSSFFDILMFAIWLYVYYFIGKSLENIWGTFRFTLFMFTGWLFIVVVTFVSYFSLGSLYGDYSQELLSFVLGRRVSTEHLYSSLFLALALLFPDMQFYMYFLIPIKAKWLAAVYIALDIYSIYQALTAGDYMTVALIVGALLNVAFFYVFGRGKAGVRGMYRNTRRKREFKSKVKRAESNTRIMHRCAICGRTEEDAPNLEFRYCSKCKGSYEYCSDHLFTHEHVQ